MNNRTRCAGQAFVQLAALNAFTHAMFTSRGLPSKADVQGFLDAGYEERQVLEIILAIAVKTLSNYSSHLFYMPLDRGFAGRTKQKPVEQMPPDPSVTSQAASLRTHVRYACAEHRKRTWVTLDLPQSRPAVASRSSADIREEAGLAEI